LTLLPTTTAAVTTAKIKPGSTAAIYIIGRTKMDEQYSCPDGCGENEGADMAWIRERVWLSDTANLEPNYLLLVF